VRIYEFDPHTSEARIRLTIYMLNNLPDFMGKQLVDFWRISGGFDFRTATIE
jgi:hypothetical protein